MSETDLKNQKQQQQN